MKKADFIRAIADKTGFTQKDIRETLGAIQDVTYETLKSGDDVTVIDGLVLKRVFKEAHNARNPQTGETIVVPGKYVPKCKIGSKIKNLFVE